METDLNQKLTTRISTAAIAAACAILGAIAATLPGSELGQGIRVLRAERIEVLDRKGVVRLVLEVRDETPQVLLMSADGRQVRLALYGHDRMPGLVVEGAGAGSIRLGAEHDKCNALRMCDGDGNTLIGAGTDGAQNAYFSLYRDDESQNPAVSAKVVGSVAELSVSDEDGKSVWRRQSRAEKE